MNLSYGLYHFQQQQYMGKLGIYPYATWMPSSSQKPKALHKLFYGLVLRYDDPFWLKHYPCARRGCQCSSRSVDEKEIIDRNLVITDGLRFLEDLMKDEQIKTWLIEDEKASIKIMEVWKPKTDIYVEKNIKNLNIFKK